MTDVIWEQRDFTDGHADPLTGAPAELVANLAAVTRVLLGLPTTTGTRARIVEEAVEEPAVMPTVAVPEPVLEPLSTIPTFPVAELEDELPPLPVSADDWASLTAPAASDLPEPAPIPTLLEVPPLVEVAPLVEVEPLVADLEPLPLHTEPATPVLDVRSAAAVLDELRFLDD